MQDDFFFNTSITPHEILEQLYLESAIDNNYYASPANPPVMRCDVSNDVRQYFKKLITVPFRDCGFLKIPAKSVYPTHQDSFRITALNMLMVDADNDFETFMFDTSSTSTFKYSVSYIRNKFTILNVMRPHGVINKSLNLDRIVLSIGIREHNYATVLNLHKENKLFRGD
jgi:hypothetical protein